MKIEEFEGRTAVFYAGAYWSIADVSGCLTATLPNGDIAADAIFLENGKFTKRCRQMANRYAATPSSWTANTIRMAIRLCKRAGIVPDELK